MKKTILVSLLTATTLLAYNEIKQEKPIETPWDIKEID